MSEKQSFRLAFAKDAAHGRRVMEHEANALVAEYRLSTDGIKPELLRYVEGIGRAVK